MSNIWHIACLNLGHDEWSVYGDGYKQAGDLIFKYIKDTQSYQDFLVYPLFFLYRQYIELRLKIIIKNGNEYLGIPKKFPRSHELAKLWKPCRRVLEEVWPGDRLEDLEDNIINYFSKIDPTSMAFRYPTDKEDSPSLPGLNTIDLKELKNRVDKIGFLLDGADLGLSTYLEQKREMQAEYY